MQIRNFSIIAHIDHGKSTLADRFLELTKTVASRQMKEQVLDAMELERERGITIKMTPVTMDYRFEDVTYRLNLIDTPGHLDFSYEVSRALKAVEGAILLVDASEGVQAQTLSVLSAAREQGLTLIPAINKIDLPSARVAAVKAELVRLLDCRPEDIFEISAKSGLGTEELLAAVIRRVPQAEEKSGDPRALVFDFEYSVHRGLIVYVRVFEGEIKRGARLIFGVAKEPFTAIETGLFRPAPMAVDALRAGEIGYIVTGVKELGQAKVGETILSAGRPQPLFSGYATPKPMVWASLYPTSQSDFNLLRQALGRLRLSDAALSFEEEAAGALGRGFRAGFLGLLHLEIVSERLRREFNLNLVVTAPSISFKITNQKNGQSETVYAHHLFPDELRDRKVVEPYIAAEILTPADYLSAILNLLQEHEGVVLETDNWADGRICLRLEMPLRELMRRFFDRLKGASSGFASLSYQLIDWRLADVAKLEILVAEEVVPALTRVVPRRRLETDARAAVDRLAELLPRQLFVVKIQARAGGRIIASRSLSAMKKDVTGYLYGGDITRKRKLWEKQARGKKRLQARARVNIPPDVFLKMVE